MNFMISATYETSVKPYRYVKIVYSKYMKFSSELLAYLRPQAVPSYFQISLSYLCSMLKRQKVVLSQRRTEKQCFPRLEVSRATARQHIKCCWHKKPYNPEQGDRTPSTMSVLKWYLEKVSLRKKERKKKETFLSGTRQQYQTRFGKERSHSKCNSAQAEVKFDRNKPKMNEFLSIFSPYPIPNGST